MLSLLLQIGDTRYALDARHVVEVLPLVPVREALTLPPALAGLMNYRGEPVPVVDLSKLYCGRPARRLLSTRVLLVRPPAPANARPEPSISWIGLMAERVTEVRQFAGNAFAKSTAIPFLGLESAVTTDANGLIHKLDLHQLFRRFACLPGASRETETLEWTSLPSF